MPSKSASTSLLWLGYRLTAAWAVELPSLCITVGAAVKSALACNFDRISKECRSWNEREVWQSLQAIVVEKIGCRESEVKESARFVEDLGID